MTKHRLFSGIVSILLLHLAAQTQTYIFGRADLTVGGTPTAIASGDFNGDGVTDLAVVNSNDNTVSILLGTGGVPSLPKLLMLQVRNRLRLLRRTSTATATWI